MNINPPLNEVMSKKLLILHPKDKLFRAKALFEKYEIHHIPIVIGEKVVGILSMGDILLMEAITDNSFDQFIQIKKYEEGSVDEFMTADPICIDISKSMMDAINIMLRLRINAIPVTEEHKLKGLITSFDILKYFKKINIEAS